MVGQQSNKKRDVKSVYKIEDRSAFKDPVFTSQRKEKNILSSASSKIKNLELNYTDNYMNMLKDTKINLITPASRTTNQSPRLQDHVSMKKNLDTQANEIYKLEAKIKEFYSSSRPRNDRTKSILNFDEQNRHVLKDNYRPGNKESNVETNSLDGSSFNWNDHLFQLERNVQPGRLLGSVDSSTLIINNKTQSQESSNYNGLDNSNSNLGFFRGIESRIEKKLAGNLNRSSYLEKNENGNYLDDVEVNKMDKADFSNRQFEDRFLKTAFNQQQQQNPTRPSSKK